MAWRGHRAALAPPILGLSAYARSLTRVWEGSGSRAPPSRHARRLRRRDADDAIPERGGDVTGPRSWVGACAPGVLLRRLVIGPRVAFDAELWFSRPAVSVSCARTPESSADPLLSCAVP